MYSVQGKGDVKCTGKRGEVECTGYNVQCTGNAEVFCGQGKGAGFYVWEGMAAGEDDILDLNND